MNIITKIVTPGVAALALGGMTANTVATAASASTAPTTVSCREMSRHVQLSRWSPARGPASLHPVSAGSICCHTSRSRLTHQAASGLVIPAGVTGVCIQLAALGCCGLLAGFPVKTGMPNWAV